MKFYITIWLLSATLLCFGQDDIFVLNKDSLDQKDEKGKKHGFWIRYLKENLKPCDIEEAHYFGYEIYDHGDRVQRFYYPHWKKRKIFKANPITKGDKKPFLLEGTFEWHNKREQLIAREVYKDGRYFFITAFKYARKDPEHVVFSENFYYDKLYSGKVGTFYYEEYVKGNLRFKGYFRKRDRGWRVYGSVKSNPKFKQSRR